MTIDLTEVPTAALLAEMDRRTRAAAPPKIWFYGVWPGHSAGHYLRDPHGQQIWNEPTVGRSRYPWDSREIRRAQDEGLLWHHHTADKTLLLSWDRSADQRGNCVCTFIIDALVTPEQALAIARESFPLVFQRIEQHLGREPRLAGPVPT